LVILRIKYTSPENDLLRQVHPRTKNNTNKIGIGIPKAHSKIHPTLPLSLLSMAIHLSFQAGTAQPR